jgi:glutathione synthase
MSQKTRRLGVVMDPIGTIKPVKDSTLAMLLEAQRRGWAISYMEQSDLSIRDGVARGRVRAREVADDTESWYRLGNPSDLALGELDAILMRKDPPFNMEYVYSTYVLERAEAAGALVVNRPAALRDMNEKAYTMWLAECCPPTLITRSHREMTAFAAEHETVVVKPLDGMGGRSIFVIRDGDPNANVIIETLTDYGTRYAMAQRYIPEIVDGGDKRILVIDGEPFGYALARIPAAGDNRGNLAAGARAEGRPLTERDRWIAERAGPLLREQGVLFAGLDVIGDYLTEVNVTSPTCIRELDREYGANIAGLLFDAIEARL